MLFTLQESRVHGRLMKKAAKLTNGDLVEIIQMRGINPGETAEDATGSAIDAVRHAVPLPAGAPVLGGHPEADFDLAGLAFPAAGAADSAADPAIPVEKARCFAVPAAPPVKTQPTRSACKPA